MRESKCLAPDVDLKVLAAKSKNFSGAEIAGLVKSATSFALYGNVDVTSADTVAAKSVNDVLVRMEDFEQALLEVVPAFGVAGEELEACLRGGMLEFGHAFRRTLHAGSSRLSRLVCVLTHVGRPHVRRPSEDQRSDAAALGVAEGQRRLRQDCIGCIASHRKRRSLRQAHQSRTVRRHVRLCESEQHL